MFFVVAAALVHRTKFHSNPPFSKRFKPHGAKQKIWQNAKKLIRDFFDFLVVFAVLLHDPHSQGKPLFLVTFSATWPQYAKIRTDNFSPKWDVRPSCIGSPCWCLSFLFKVPKLVRRQIPIWVTKLLWGPGQRRVGQRWWKAEVQHNDHMTNTKKQKKGTDIKRKA